MTKTNQPNGAYLRNLEQAFDRFAGLVEAENDALEHRDSVRLQNLTPQKVEAGEALDALTREFRARFENAAPEESAAFAEQVTRAAGLRPMLERNMALLNAAKVACANRIEDGLAAWRRSQREKTPGYADDGRTSLSEQAEPTQPVRLI